MKSLKELVFALPTDELWKLISYKKRGLIREKSQLLKSIVQKGVFKKRGELEPDPSYKQIIPYVIISTDDYFYLFRRTAKQTEERLHNKLSLGVGGHMNPNENIKSYQQFLTQELKREFYEEVILQDDCQINEIKFIGYLNDDTNSVGSVHLGLLYNIHLSNKNIRINETDKMTANWVHKTELNYSYDDMETWTKITFDNYIK